MSNEGDDELSRVVGCTPIRLEDMHLAEIRSLIARLPVDLMKQSQEEKNLERFQKLIELYGDEPQLLDPPMPELIESLVRHIQWQDSGDIGRLNAAALVRLQVLSAVRGYKFLIRFIPHNIELLESVLSSLERLAKHLAEPKKAVVLTPLPGPSTSRVNPAVDRQILQFLVVWLMIICKNPFNLGRIQAMESQSGNGNTANHLSIPERIVACLDAILECMTSGGGLNVVPNLLAQILTRNVDNRPALTTRFEHFQRCFQEFQHDLDGGKLLINQLALANAMLKLARRDEIHPFAIRLFRSLSPDFMGAQKCQNILIRNLITKLMQRIALVLLRPKLAPWRYRCGHRSLEENLRRAPGREEEVKAMESKKSDERREEDGQKETDEEINKHIPYDEVELLLGQLLLKVRDRDNLVRWTASKGVARISARIPLEMAAQVVAAVFNDCFRSVDADSDETASAWMGGCLTVAELCRRGCLLPEQVPKVISDVLSRALIFEQSQSAFVLAVNVRDAACYICWAFARAYEASLLRPHFRSLGGTLLCTALFDREVNVRRAASAAFQENVGRNDSFPQGIPVIQRVDYMAVARIRHCYLELSVQIAQFADYIRPMLNHLCSLKLRHWDKTLRELAADALQRLAPFDVDHAGNELLPDLCRRLQSPDSAEAHGAFFGMASLLEALAGQRDALLHQIHPQLIEAIRQRASKLESHRSQGFSLAGKSLCRLIEALCKTGCQLEDEQLTQFHDILDTVVGDRNAQMAGQAVNAFPWLMAYYEDQQHFQLLMERLRGKYFAELDNLSQTEQLRCSCILPLGHLRPRFLDARFPNNPNPRRKIAATQPTLGSALFCKLFDVIEDPKTPKWVFARVAAIETMVRLVLNAHQQPPRFFYTLDWPKLVECLCHAADDYTATTNGNIGRFARRAAVLAMGQLLPVAFEESGEEEGEAMITRPQLTMAIGKIVERACESIDDLREKASTVLASLVQFGPTTQLRSNIAELELLQGVFLLSSSANDGSAISSSSPRTTMEKEEEKGQQQQLVTDGREEDGAELHGAAEEEKVATDFVAVDWRQSKGFARLAPLLGSQAYGENALNGFVLSAGSICAWTRENAFLAIASHLKPHKRDMEFLNSFLDRLSRVYGTLDARGCDPSPVLILFRMLLNDGQLRALERQPDSSVQFTRFCELVFTLVKVKGRSKVKLEAIAVLGSLLQLNPESGLYRRVLGLLLSLLDSPYAALREKAAQQLFEAFSLLVEDELEESAEGEEPASATTGNCVGQAVELLSQTDWGAANELAEMRKRSGQIRELLLLRKSIQE